MLDTFDSMTGAAGDQEVHMDHRCVLLLGGVLLACSARADAQQRPTGEIPGDRGELVKPIIPSPPTYTGDASQELRRQSDQMCEPPKEGYLDPRVAKPAPPLEPAQLYSGWLARSLLGQKVYGREGHQIGEVQDILFGPKANVAAIIVEGGGFLEVGVGAFRVSWEQVEQTPGRNGIAISRSETEVERMDLFDDGKVQSDRREFRVSQIIGDWTRIGNETNPCFIKRGYVTDVVIDRDGRLRAILEARSFRLGGGNAFPFYDYQAGWRPHYGYYDLPLENMSQPAPKVRRGRFAGL